MNRGMSQSSLKYIAILSMLLDHLGVLLYERIPEWTYDVLRMSGRLAFPIFCFCLVEGYLHTRSFSKYAMRLGIFALVSEIPFDLLIHKSLLYPQGNNVMFTLWIGLVVIHMMSHYMDQGTRGMLYIFLIVTLGMGLAELLQVDYSWRGVILVVLLYFTRDQKWLMIGSGVVIMLMGNSILEITAPLAFIPVYFYNGTRGSQPKYLFYLFYPIHLLVLGLMGISIL